MTKSPKIYQICRSFSKKYGKPKDFWQKWCKRQKTKKEKEEIVIGAILTQRTNWRNVELALANLKKEKILSIKGIYLAYRKNKRLLENLIRPSGFYKQKAKRLFQLCQFIVKNYETLEKFFNQNLDKCREELLRIYGIGPETADSILLYAGGKPIFVIDEYTRRFAKKHHLLKKLSKKFSYDYLQQLFQENLPRNTKIYQDFHAMIVLEGKRNNKN